MTKAVLPQMRIRRSGVIVNVSSTVTIKLLPELTVYSASKAALNTFTKVSLWRRLCLECVRNLFYPVRRQRPGLEKMRWRAWGWRSPNRIAHSSTTT